MNNIWSFSCVIVYRHDNQRLNNLKRILDWLIGFSGVEIIIVEQDTHSKLKYLNLPCKLIFTKSDKPINKAWGFNIGLKWSNSNRIVFTDSDLIMDPNRFIESLKLLDEYEMVSPYNSVVDLTPEESQSQIVDIFKIDRVGRGEEDHQKVPLCGGTCMFRRDAIEKIGGWNESFIGWGGEDDFQSIKVKNFLTWKEVEGKCYHLYHDRFAPDMKWYNRNLQLLQSLSNLSKEDLVKSINNSKSKIGMKNLYDDF